MADEEIPRLFQLRTGEQLNELLAHGVQWPNDMLTLNWVAHAELATTVTTWSSFDALADKTPEWSTLTVVWLLQNTYATPGPTP